MSLTDTHVYLRNHPAVDPAFVGVLCVVKYVEVDDDDNVILTVRQARNGVSPCWMQGDFGHRLKYRFRASEEFGGYRNVPIDALDQYAISLNTGELGSTAGEKFVPYARHHIGRYTDGRPFMSVFHTPKTTLF